MSPGAATGTHLLIDFYDARNLADADGIEQALRNAAAACGATVIEVLLHRFGAGGGVTGMALLAESHISIHTWPDTGFAAIDVFVCGACDPDKGVPILQDYFRPREIEVTRSRRGRLREGRTAP